jgi:hypothetical protein
MADLIKGGLITFEEAVKYTTRPDELRRSIKV